MNYNIDETSFLKSIDKDNLANLGEVLLDFNLSEGIIKDIPILSTIISTGKTILDVRDKLFIKKILKFLYTLSSISTEERISFIEKINSNKKLKNIISSNILLLLDKIHEIDKSNLIAIAFTEYIKEKISIEELELILNAIEKSPLVDLQKLPNLNIFDFSVNEGILDRLFSAGLYSFTHASGTLGGGGTEYSPNKLNQIMIQIIKKSEEIGN